MLRPNHPQKQLPLWLWHARDFNGHEIICRQDDFATSVEFPGSTFGIFHRRSLDLNHPLKGLRYFNLVFHQEVVCADTLGCWP